MVEEDSGEEADECGLVGDGFEVEAIGDPCFAGDVVEPAFCADGADGGELGEEAVFGADPADEGVGFLAVVDACGAEAAFECGGDAVAEFFTGDAVDDGGGEVEEVEFLFEAVDEFLWDGDFAAALGEGAEGFVFAFEEFVFLLGDAELVFEFR